MNNYMNEERIPFRYEMTHEDREVCNASYQEVILYYFLYPGFFLRALYQSISTLSWRF